VAEADQVQDEMNRDHGQRLAVQHERCPEQQNPGSRSTREVEPLAELRPLSVAFRGAVWRSAIACRGTVITLYTASRSTAWRQPKTLTSWPVKGNEDRAGKSADERDGQ
jgi:hypothetical protein